MTATRRPTTDTGTVVVHFFLIVCFATLLLTGLRIASDDPEAGWLVVLDFVLPVEQLWYRHMAAAVVLIAALSFHGLYLKRAQLSARIRLDGSRIAALLQRGRPRRLALNTLIVWSLLMALLVEAASGVLLFLEVSGPHLAIHRVTTWLLCGLVAAHIACHAAIGGRGQLCRILRPAPVDTPTPAPDLAEVVAHLLAEPGCRGRRPVVSPGHAGTIPGRRRHPAGPALALAAAMIVAGLALEQSTRPVLRVPEIEADDAPTVDGDLSEPVWATARPVRLVTTQGGDFGNSGTSAVEVRALHDGRHAYFAFVWDDPTHSLKHRPLTKTASGWRLIETATEARMEAVHNEDKFSVLLSRSVFPLIGAAIHLTPSAGNDHPPSSTGRGLHYTADGSIADVWVWRASHGCATGHVDNAHFGRIERSTAKGQHDKDGYAGGFALDPGRVPYRPNLLTRRPEGDVVPLRLPTDPRANAAQLGRPSAKVGESEPQGSRWWMSHAESTPFTAEIDRLFPVGSIIPGVLCDSAPALDDASVRGVARWASGRWTLEVVRRLHTGSRYDVPIKSGVLMWVAAFDHAETRHSRHLRPLRLEVD